LIPSEECEVYRKLGHCYHMCLLSKLHKGNYDRWWAR